MAPPRRPPVVKRKFMTPLNSLRDARGWAFSGLAGLVNID
jgi:hypothetical protein